MSHYKQRIKWDPSVRFFKGLCCYGCPLFMYGQILKIIYGLTKIFEPKFASIKTDLGQLARWLCLGTFGPSYHFSCRCEATLHADCLYRRYKILQSQILSGVIFHSLSPPACRRQVKYEQMDWAIPRNHSRERCLCGTTYVFLRVVKIKFLKIKSSFSSDLQQNLREALSSFLIDFELAVLPAMLSLNSSVPFPNPKWVMTCKQIGVNQRTFLTLYLVPGVSQRWKTLVLVLALLPQSCLSLSKVFFSFRHHFLICIY